MIIELSAPIRAHGEERHSIELREPNGADIAACGVPIRAGADGSEMSLDAGVVHKFIARLGNIPPNAAGQLCAQDWMKCMTAIAGFFGQGEGEETTSSTDTSISPGSGNGRQRRPSA